MPKSKEIVVKAFAIVSNNQVPITACRFRTKLTDVLISPWSVFESKLNAEIALREAENKSLPEDVEIVPVTIRYRLRGKGKGGKK